MSDLERVWLEVDLERIPDIEGDEWVEWCGKRDLYALNGGRRAWIPRLSTYLRDDDCLLFYDGTLIATFRMESLKAQDPGGKAMWGKAL